MDDWQGCLIEWAHDDNLDRDLSPGNVEEMIRRYSEKEVTTW